MIKAEIHETEMITKQRIRELKSFFLKDKIDKPLAQLIRRQREDLNVYDQR